MELKEKYIISNEKNKKRIGKSLISYFDTSKDILKVALKFLNEKELEILMLKYDENFISKGSIDHNKQSYLNVGLIPKLKKIIEFINNNVDMEDLPILLKEEGKSKVLILKSKYNLERGWDYKSFYSYFNDSKVLVRLAVMLLGDDKRKVIYKKYNEDLENVSVRVKMSSKELDIVNRSIKEIKEILSFLKVFGITEEEAKYLVSKNEKEELLILKGMFISECSKNNNYKYFYRNFTFSKELVFWAFNKLDSKEKRVLVSYYGSGLDNLLDLKLTEKNRRYLKMIFTKIRILCLNEESLIRHNETYIKLQKSLVKFGCVYLINSVKKSINREKAIDEFCKEVVVMYSDGVKMIKPVEGKNIDRIIEEFISNLLNVESMYKNEDFNYIISVLLKYYYSDIFTDKEIIKITRINENDLANLCGISIKRKIKRPISQ